MDIQEIEHKIACNESELDAALEKQKDKIIERVAELDIEMKLMDILALQEAILDARIEVSDE